MPLGATHDINICISVPPSLPTVHFREYAVGAKHTFAADTDEKQYKVSVYFLEQVGAYKKDSWASKKSRLFSNSTGVHLLLVTLNT